MNVKILRNLHGTNTLQLRNSRTLVHVRKKTGLVLYSSVQSTAITQRLSIKNLHTIVSKKLTVLIIFSQEFTHNCQ